MREWEIDPEFILKATPPKTPKGIAHRQRLSIDLWASYRSPLFLIEAPPGYGKTLLLAQWRRTHIGLGGVVAWLSVDERDNALRFVYGLACAMRMASGHKAFDQSFMNWLGQQQEISKALTGWLAEVAEKPVDTVLMLDLAESIPADLWDTLAYLTHNAPTNLRIVIATRPIVEDASAQILLRQASIRIGATDLTFSLDETVLVLKTQLGKHFNEDICARLHAITGGWPLGLQLAAAIFKNSPEMFLSAESAISSSSDMRRYFIDTLASQLPKEEFDLLVRLSAFKYFHPDLCGTIIGRSDAHILLEQLRRDTPVIIEVGAGPWYSMHPLARDFLSGYFNALPEEERLTISRKSSEWLGMKGLYEDAANHAFKAGDHNLAYGFVERALREMYAQGQVSLVIEWFDRMPETEIERRPSLQFSAAWGLASSARYAESEKFVKRILAAPNVTEGERFEAEMIAGAAASFSDQLDECAQIMARWPVPPKDVDPPVFRAYLNHLAIVELHRGGTEKARHYLMHLLSVGGTDVSYAFCDLNVAISYLWEGQVALAVQVARPALSKIEKQMGRRSPIACMIAVVLARALWEQDQGDEARLVMAHRLDVLEQAGLPLTILLGYITLALFAECDGDEAKALSLLDGLFALGEIRSMPRLSIAALCEQIRFHAVRGRTETVLDMSERLDRIADACDSMKAGVLGDWLEMHLERAHAYKDLAQSDWTSMLAHTAAAGECASRLRRLRDLTEIRLLRALALERSGGDGTSLFNESVSLAVASSLHQVLRKAHPDICQILNHRFQYGTPPGVGAPPPEESSLAKAKAVSRSAILTGKEMEILVLMARGISNKEIAYSLDVGEETIKWHIKNLFRKLDVGTRRQAVNRANMLGIIDFSLIVN